MSAFSTQMLYNLHNANDKLARRMASLFECTIDPVLIYNTIIPDDDRIVLKRAKELGCKSRNYHSQVTFAHRSGRYVVDLEHVGIVPPTYVEKRQTLDENYPFAPDMIAWGGQVHTVAANFTIGRELISLLSERCKSTKQVRYFLPGILVLLKTAGYEDLASKVADTQMLRNPPSLPPNVRPYLAEYNSLLSKVSLLPTEDRGRRRNEPMFRTDEEVLVPWTGKGAQIIDV